MSADGSALVESWRKSLADAAGVRLRGSLHLFPELDRAVALPQLITDVQEDSYLSWNGVGIEAEVQVVWRTPGGARVGTLSLDLYTADGTASLEDMHLPQRFQGRGLGRAVVAELVALGTALGLDELITLAADVGRYSWARCCFDFMKKEDRELALAAAGKFAAQLGRPFDMSSLAYSWDLAELPGEDVPLAEVAAARGDQPPSADAPAMKLGQALLLGPRNNDWAGRLELASGSPSRVQLAKG